MAEGAPRGALPLSIGGRYGRVGAATPTTGRQQPMQSTRQSKPCSTPPPKWPRTRHASTEQHPCPARANTPQHPTPHACGAPKIVAPAAVEGTGPPMEVVAEEVYRGRCHVRHGASLCETRPCPKIYQRSRSSARQPVKPEHPRAFAGTTAAGGESPSTRT